MVKRTLSVVLILGTLTQPVAPALAQQLPAGVMITSIDRGSVRPFDRLVISGSGFQPAIAAISVLFVPQQHGVPVVIPVFSATATQVEVIVPAFLDPTTGDFGFGQADVQVVQVTRDAVMSSNVLSGLDVAPIPSLPDSSGTGRVTRAFMRLSVEFISAGMATPDPEARAAFAAFRDEQAALLAQVEAVVTNPASVAHASTIESAPFAIDAPMLRTSDRLIAAYLNSLTPLIDGQQLNGRVTPMADASCSFDTGTSWIEDKFCQFRTTVLGEQRKWITGVAVVAATAGTAAALIVSSPLMIALGVGIAGVGVAALATQILYLGVSGALVPSFLAADAPPLIDTLRYHARKMFDDATARGTTAIASATLKASDAVALVAARVRSGPDASPKGGSMIATARIDPADPIRPMTSYQGSGTATVATSVGVPSTQLTRTFFEARLAAPSISWFDGTYSGTVVIIDPQYDGGTIPLRFTVAGGTVTLTGPLGGTGSISLVGRVQVVLSLAGCPMSGTIETKSATATAVGGGVLPLCRDGGHGTGWGFWNATRRP